MAKVEVRIKTCCCCGLQIASILTAIYALIYYIIVLGLASSGLSRTPPTGVEDPNYYQLCLSEARSDEKGVTVSDDGRTRVILIDASNRPYYCSLGMYTEELKFHHGIRFPILVIDVILYVLLTLCSALLFVALFCNIHWLLLPWIGLMCLDVIRGFISCILIFVWSYGSLVRIAVGIFFLGIQLFHISLILIIIAKFQRMYNKSRGIDYKMDINTEKSIMADGGQMYPTLPSQYPYTASPHMRREGYYQPNYYNTYAGKEGRGYRDMGPPPPPPDPSRQYNTMYSSQYRQDASNFGRTM